MKIMPKRYRQERNPMSKNKIIDKPLVPKDLGLKIGSEAEVFWTGVKDTLKATMKQAYNQNLVNKELLVIANRKILEEQRKAKV